MSYKPSAEIEKPVPSILTPLVPQLTRLAENSIIPRTDKLMQDVRCTYEPNFAEEVVAARKRSEILFLIANHQSHPDILSTVKIKRHIDWILEQAGLQPPSRYYIPGARSMWTGHQGLAIKILNQAMCERLEGDNITSVPITREADHERYGLELKNPELYEVIRDILRSRNGLILFPEGSMAPGRTRKGWPFKLPPFCFLPSVAEDINGMIEPRDHLIDRLAKLAKRTETDLAIIRIATHGAYRIFSPNCGFLTPQALLALYTGKDTPQVDIHINAPINTAAITAEINNSGGSTHPYPIEDWVLRQIAKNLPPVAQGKYS